jgi:pyruvate dehydrogenase E2 component (dihydrolipoamide acetyltransferase)
MDQEFSKEAKMNQDANVILRPLSKTQKVMARHMATAWQAPMFNVTVEIDMHDAIKNRPSGASVTDVILTACAKTLDEFPALNAWYMDNSVREFTSINIGLAVASDRGLTVPVIRDAQAKDVFGIANARGILVDKVRSGTIAVSELMDGTFTVSNLGMLGVTRFTAIINPPQVAILAIGSTQKKYIWTPAGPEWRDISEFTMTCDHRAVDGALAARFLGALKQELESESLD